MSLLKRILFKLMELGLGLRPYFSLRTRDPVFANFRLSGAETDAVRRLLPPGYELCAIRFLSSDPEPSYWLSYNLYELRYPRPEMAAIRKVRCEVNTFVRDASGRQGVFVFFGSPFVSKEETTSPIGRVADMAERLVGFIYGCGRLARVRYELTPTAMRIELEQPEAALSLDAPIAPDTPGERLSDDYLRMNDVSFFNGGKSHDLVSVGSSFFLAAFESLDPGAVSRSVGRCAALERAPDRVLFHRGEIEYLVSALHAPPRLPATRDVRALPTASRG